MSCNFFMLAGIKSKVSGVYICEGLPLDYNHIDLVLETVVLHSKLGELFINSKKVKVVIKGLNLESINWIF